MMDFQNSCAPVVLTPLLRVPTQERPSQVSSHLEPHRRLAQVGSVAWFLSCGPMKVEPSHPRRRLSSWGAVLSQPSLAGHPHRGLSSPWGLREALGPKAAWCPADGPGSRLAPSWGSQDKGWALGTPGQAAGQTPPNPPPSSDGFILVLLIGLGEGWEVPWMEAGSLFSQAPTD